MLKLFHHGSSVCAAKVRLVLAEKGLEWEGAYVDVLRGDQFAPEYLRLNPKGVVPMLVHDDAVITESTVIAEYLDDAFVSQPLKPADALARAKMRLWSKAVDEYLHPACGEITFAACHRHIVARLPEVEFERFLASTPAISVTASWHVRKKEIVRHGMAAPGIGETFRLYDMHLQKMEEALAAGPWLTGEEFSLADIALTPYVNRLDMLGMSGMWIGKRHNLSDWFARIKARPSFRPMLLDMCPADLTDDLLTYGRQSWPEVQRLLMH